MSTQHTVEFGIDRPARVAEYRNGPETVSVVDDQYFMQGDFSDAAVRARDLVKRQRAALETANEARKEMIAALALYLWDEESDEDGERCYHIHPDPAHVASDEMADAEAALPHLMEEGERWGQASCDLTNAYTAIKTESNRRSAVYAREYLAAAMARLG